MLIVVEFGQLWPALIIGWIYWLPVHTLTYALVPLRYRLFWVNFMSIWWGGAYMKLLLMCPFLPCF